MAYYKTRNTGTQNNGTRNTDGTAEHSGIVAEQRNTSGTPRNNVTLHDEEQLYLCVDYKQKFNKHLEITLKKAGQNVNAFLRILRYKNFEKKPDELFLRYSCFLLLPFSKDVLQP